LALKIVGASLPQPPLLWLLRPNDGLSQLADALETLGYKVVQHALTEVVPLAWDDDASKKALPTTVDWVMLSSRNGALHGQALIKQARQHGAKLAVVGEGTHHWVKNQGFAVDYVSPKPHAQGLVEGLTSFWQEQGIERQTLVWPRSQQANLSPKIALEQAEHVVFDVAVYQTTALSAEAFLPLKQALHHAQTTPNAIVVTSPSGADALAKAQLDLPPWVQLVSLGASTTLAILNQDWGVGFVEATAPTALAIHEALLDVDVVQQA
jgi:uroporphyrinogen-III synthase